MKYGGNCINKAGETDVWRAPVRLQFAILRHLLPRRLVSLCRPVFPSLPPRAWPLPVSARQRRSSAQKTVSDLGKDQTYFDKSERQITIGLLDRSSDYVLSSIEEYQS